MKLRVLALTSLLMFAFVGFSAAATSLTWSMRAPLPTPRNDLDAVTAPDGRVYAISGSLAETMMAAYDPATDSWTARASLPSPRANSGTAVGTNGKIYTIGGWAPGTAASTFEYDPTLNAWTAKANMPTARYHLAAVGAANGMVYAIGGAAVNFSPFPCVAVVEQYDPATDVWSTKAPMPTARCLIGLASASNGRIYAVGGTSGSGGPFASTYFASLEEYNPASDTWTSKAPMPTARIGLGLVATSDGKLYAIGGQDTSANDVTTVEEYDIATDTWTTVTPISVPRRDLGAAVTAGKIYAVGGENSTGVLATNEEGSFGTLTVGPPTDTNQCKNGGWMLFNTPKLFKSQGDCIQFVNTGK
jgi:N-acetylneuraminic acid mutarotase